MSLRFVILALLLGCASKQGAGGSRLGKSEGRYALGKPGKGWSRVSPGGADKAWFNDDLAATIYFDSNCKARFEDKTLDALITHLTFGMAQGEPLKEQTMELDGREALMRVYGGEIDGVSVQIAATVMKKNSCIYDGLYISSPRSFDAGLSSFEQVISGFKS